jgi:hypothetical protein
VFLSSPCCGLSPVFWGNPLNHIYGEYYTTFRVNLKGKQVGKPEFTATKNGQRIGLCPWVKIPRGRLPPSFFI